MAYNFGPVKPHVKAAGEYFGSRYGLTSIGGWRAIGSVPNSDHPKGLALDLMTRDKAKGDAIAAEAVRDAGKWGISYVIWWRRIWTPSKGWHTYSGPSPHTDHVHLSFNATPGSGGGGSSSGGSGGTSGVANPLVPDSVERFLQWVEDPDLWTKVGLYAIGVSLIIIGFLLLTFGSLPGPKTAVKLATKVLK